MVIRMIRLKERRTSVDSRNNASAENIIDRRDMPLQNTVNRNERSGAVPVDAARRHEVVSSTLGDFREAWDRLADL